MKDSSPGMAPCRSNCGNHLDLLSCSDLHQFHRFICVLHYFPVNLIKWKMTWRCIRCALVCEVRTVLLFFLNGLMVPTSFYLFPITFARKIMVKNSCMHLILYLLGIRKMLPFSWQIRIQCRKFSPDFFHFHGYLLLHVIDLWSLILTFLWQFNSF